MIVCLTLWLTFSSAHAQGQGQNQQQLPPMPLPGQNDQQQDPNRAKLERELAKKTNQERQAALKRDTDKLLKLATELKDYVDKTNESVLSLDVVKKAEEIEKLAHSVKEKMKAN